MSVRATVLFDTPQTEIASLISERLSRSISTSIVTGFATPGGINALGDSLVARPDAISEIVVGAATYPGFEALEGLLSAGVPRDRLFVHLGHTRSSLGRKNPFVRFHPMLHSKIFYTEHSDGEASAFIGSNNVTAFALGGLNGEATVLLEGPKNSTEFESIRQHIEIARKQSARYSPGMKEAFAWWTREFLEGLRAEIRIPQDWITVRTILIFASLEGRRRPKRGDQLYFEIPSGIEQIESLKTEAHLFLFRELPADPWEAIKRSASAEAAYTCKVQGAENKQGNIEVSADWKLDDSRAPVLCEVPDGTFRPSRVGDMQQVRAEVEKSYIDPYDYLFERDRKTWKPVLAKHKQDMPEHFARRDFARQSAEDMDAAGWSLVKDLAPSGSAREKDEAALKLVAPDSGSFVLVSLRRREK